MSTLLSRAKETTTPVVGVLKEDIIASKLARRQSAESRKSSGNVSTSNTIVTEAVISAQSDTKCNNEPLTSDVNKVKVSNKNDDEIQAVAQLPIQAVDTGPTDSVGIKKNVSPLVKKKSTKPGNLPATASTSQIISKAVKKSRRPMKNNQKPKDDSFVIFNFFEIISPPPMFTNFKDGFMHFMHVAVEHCQFVEGFLLKDIVAKGKFPYVHVSYFDLNGVNFQHDPRWVRAIIEGHGNLQVHHQAGFNQLCTYTDDYAGWNPKAGKDRTAYLIIVFKAEGNFDLLDETSQKWSGADFIKHHIPKEVKISKMILYKRCVPHGTFMYVFLCELKNGLMYANSLLDLVERLNERSCGYASLYHIDETF